MRPVPLLLMLAGAMLLGAVVGRYMYGGPPGGKTWATIAVGLVLLAAGLAALRRRTDVVHTSTVPPTVR